MALTMGVPLAGASELGSTISTGIHALGGSQTNDMDAQDYADLGLHVDNSTAGGENPISASTTTRLRTRSEVYMAANGNNNNKYLVRDILERLRGASDMSTKAKDDYGSVYGAINTWDDVNKRDSESIYENSEYGGGTWSGLSQNESSTILKKDGNGFSGQHATSVAFSNSTGIYSKDTCVAELRAYGDKDSTSINGTSYKGKIAISLFQFDEHGNRSSIGQLVPTYNSSQVYSYNSKNRFRYLTAGYLQELDAVFSIAAADLDGDGKDELLSYSGAFVDQDSKRMAIINMFKQDSNGSWNTYEVKVDAGYASDYISDSDLEYREDQALQNTPVVTISAGDLDRNGNEDVAITVSSPMGKKCVYESARCELFTWDGSKLAHVDGVGDNGIVKLDDPHSSKAMVSANSTFGTFDAYDSDGNRTGNSVTGLIIAGYESLDSTCTYDDDKYYTKAAYRFVYFSTEEGRFKVSDYKSVGLEQSARLIAKSAAEDCDQKGRYACTLAPFALETCNLKGINAGGSYNEAVFFGGDIYKNFTCSVNSSYGGLGSCGGHVSLCKTRYNLYDKLFTKGTEQIWISDVQAGCVSGWDEMNESFLAVVGVHRDEDLHKDDDYYWMGVAHYTTDSSGRDRTAEEEIIKESNRRNPTYGSFVSLALPDIDKDGVYFRYVDAYKVYSDPHVLAVLQDSPYFGDLQESFDYISGGSTAFGTGTSSSHSDGLSVEFAPHVLIGGSIGASVLEVEAEASFGLNCGYGFEMANSTSYSVSYDAEAGGGHRVVLEAVPTICYVYDVVDEATGTVGSMTAPLVLGTVTSVVPAELYDEKAAEHGMTTISSFIKANSGNPSSYRTEFDSQDRTTSDSLGYMAGHENTTNIERVYTGTSWAGAVAGGDASTSMGVEADHETSHEMEVGLGINYSIAGGVEFGKNSFESGIDVDFALGYTGSWSYSNSEDFECTVDNLPEEAGASYGFSWRTAVNKMDLPEVYDPQTGALLSTGDTGDMWIIGYDVKDVTSPVAPAITGLSAVSAESSAVELSWNNVLAKDSGLRYGVAMLGSNTSGELVVTDWKTADAGVTSLSWTGLTPNTEYRFAIAAVNGQGEQKGVRSPVVSVSTLPAGMSIQVEGPAPSEAALAQDSPSTIEVDDDGSVTLYARGIINTNGSTSANGTVSAKYSWYRKAAGAKEWELVARSEASSPGSVAKLALKKLSVSENNGDQYSCTVSYQNNSLSTGAVKLAVNGVEIDQPSMSSSVQTTKRYLRNLVSSKAKRFERVAKDVGTVKSLKASVAGKRTLKVSWKQVKKAKSYKIAYKKSDAKRYNYLIVKAGNASTQKATLAGLSKGKRYTLYVQAYNSYGGRGTLIAYSPSVKTKKIA